MKIIIIKNKEITFLKQPVGTFCISLGIFQQIFPKLTRIRWSTFPLPLQVDMKCYSFETQLKGMTYKYHFKGAKTLMIIMKYG
jgi:hypothetical protein